MHGTRVCKSIPRSLLGGVVILFVLASTGILLDEFRVEETEGTIVVRWTSVQETSVRAYEVHRRTRSSDNQFVRVASIPPHGTGRPYEFRDTQVFKAAADDVTYRLEGIRTNGERVGLGERSVSYSPTAVRRTWGSIKAMFQ
jgi:hypothetical protein